MSEFGDTYFPVTSKNVLSMPPSAGIALAGLGRVRPFFFFRHGTSHNLLAALEDPTAIAIWLNNRAGGLPGVRVSPARAGQPLVDQATRLSFLYYRAQNGVPETAYRDITILPDEVSIGYGVHPDHTGEEPTWYFRGWHTGYSYPDQEGELVAGEEVTNLQIKNFSLARIVGGPLGDPATDQAFRDQMGIATIPAP